MATEFPGDLSGPAQVPVNGVLTLAGIRQSLTMPTGELGIAVQVQNRYSLATILSGTAKPGPLAAEGAGRPVESDRVLHLRQGAIASCMTISQHYLLLFDSNRDTEDQGVLLPPPHLEAQSRLHHAFTLPVPNIQRPVVRDRALRALMFVPAAANAAHDSPFLSK